jgi:plasmid stabilization system protein ParE
MSFEMTISERAAVELDEIVDFLLQFDEGVALRMRAEITDYIVKLRLNPFVGDIIRRTRKHVTRETHFKAYRIYFRVNESEQSILILSIRHYKRRPLKSLE